MFYMDYSDNGMHVLPPCLGGVRLPGRSDAFIQSLSLKGWLSSALLLEAALDPPVAGEVSRILPPGPEGARLPLPPSG